MDRYTGAPPRLVPSQRIGRGSGAELILVEGDSAGKAVVRARDPRTQAVLALQGKPLNAARAKRAKVAANAHYRAIIDCLGAGFDPDVAPYRAHYDRVVLLFDPDADGIHAGALTLLFFATWMRAVLEAGMLLSVRAPIVTLEHERLSEPIHAVSPAKLQTY